MSTRKARLKPAGEFHDALWPPTEVGDKRPSAEADERQLNHIGRWSCMRSVPRESEVQKTASKPLALRRNVKGKRARLGKGNSEVSEGGLIGAEHFRGVLSHRFQLRAARRRFHHRHSLVMNRRFMLARHRKHAPALAAAVSSAVHASRQDGGVIALRTIHIERHGNFSNRLGRMDHDI